MLWNVVIYYQKRQGDGYDEDEVLGLLWGLRSLPAGIVGECCKNGDFFEEFRDEYTLEDLGLNWW